MFAIQIRSTDEEHCSLHTRGLIHMIADDCFKFLNILLS